MDGVSQAGQRNVCGILKQLKITQRSNTPVILWVTSYAFFAQAFAAVGSTLDKAKRMKRHE